MFRWTIKIGHKGEIKSILEMYDYFGLCEVEVVEEVETGYCYFW